MSKTPQFDKALDEYFSNLKLDEKGGQWRTCRFSGEKFYVRPEDIEFYKNIRVSLPTLTPYERVRRKLALWNSYNLFYSKSSFSGEKIITQYPPNTPYKIYEHRAWFGEKWDPFESSRDYDSNKSFFKQYRELQLAVPRPNLYVDNTSTNSDYTNDSNRLKNCYLIFNSNNSEDCYYGIAVSDSKNCVEGFDVHHSEITYDCFESYNLYDCFFLEWSRDCLDSFFLYDCRDCDHCFGGINLRHKKYIFWGEQLTKEEYEKRIKSINLGDRDTLNFYKNKFEELKKKAIHKPDHNEKEVNSLGDYIVKSKNCYACLWQEESENVAYSLGGEFNKDSYDIIAINTEFSYEVSAGYRSHHLLFCGHIEDSHDMEYCDLCLNCHNCFGCIGLRNKSFCIFNKQYSEEEYWQKIDEIKTDMLRNREYGEFFLPDTSPFPYNISIATSYKGYDDIETAKKYGYRVEKVEESLYEMGGDTIAAESLPKDIKEVDDAILDKVIFDSKNNKKFRYVKGELDFYRRYNLPLPLEHYSIRLANKRKRFGDISLRFFEGTCQKCGKKIQSTYPKGDPRTVYCNECYFREII